MSLNAVPAEETPVIHLACATDEKYAVYCAAMLHSALTGCAPLRLEVHFLHPESLSGQTLQRLRQLVEGAGSRFTPTAIDARTARTLPAAGRYPEVIWYRVLLPQLRPKLDRVLYLDCDTLILDTLLPLWQTGLENADVAAVQNLIEPHLATRHYALGIPPDQIYFNSGVLLLNLAAMRRDQCFERLLRHARQYEGQSIWPDQDSLNYVLGPKCSFLHPRWNCQNSFFYWPQAKAVFGEAVLAEATGSPAILHFEGPPDTKPWHYLNTHPYRKRYWRHLRSTPFPAPRVTGKTLGNVLRKYLPRPVYEGLRRVRRKLVAGKR